MKKHLMPLDEGLKEPVRKFKDTFSGEDLVLEMINNGRNETQTRSDESTRSSFG